MSERTILDKAVSDKTLTGLDPERRRGMEFLREHLPESDLACYPPGLFLRFVDHALALRESVLWCGELDWEIFAHYVLFPRVNDEDLSFHRDIFYAALWPRVRDLPTMEARILEVNRWCHECASYQAQDERTASPLTVYRCGSGRCGEESAFLVSALRSVGIAARQVYAPRWSHCDDNHAWVEALCGGQWRYLGACEPEPVLDRGWFTTAASRAVLVHSRVFGEGRSPLHGELLGREGGVSWFNQTARYAETKKYVFRALAEGKPAAGAEFQLQILNEASFHTIAVLTADERGEAAAALGQGSLYAAASLGPLAAGGMCGEHGITLHLAPAAAGDTPWTDFDFHAPTDCRPAPAVLSGALKAARAEALRHGDAVRLGRLEGLLQPGREEWADLLRAARGNCGEVLAFLSGPGPDRRERLVRTLSDKDLRDVTRAVLEDHLAHLPPKPANMPVEIYWSFAACPRVALEPLTPWRGALKDWMSDWTGTPAALRRILPELLTQPGGRGYDRLYWTPAAALEAGACDEKSRYVLLTAALRTLGVPARLRPLDGAVEYWALGAFHSVVPEACGVLRLTAPAGTELRAGRDWSLSRWTGEGWRLLCPGDGWENGALALKIPAGRYRLITTVRLPGGDQLASRRELDLAAGEERTVPLRLRPWALDDLLTGQALPVLAAQTLEGGAVPDLLRVDEGPALVFWLRPGDEPTEHVLNELLEQGRTLDALPLRVRFLVEGRDCLSQPTMAKVLARFPRIQVLLDDWAYDLEAIARHLGRDPDSPPLAVVCGGGRAVYSDCGYRVGAVELLLKAAAHLTKGRP